MEVEGGPSLPRFKPDRPVVGFDDPASDEQPKPRSVSAVASGVAPGEGVEDHGALRERDPLAPIPNAHGHRVAGCRDRDDDLGGRRGVARGVSQEVQDRDPKLAPVLKMASAFIPPEDVERVRKELEENLGEGTQDFLRAVKDRVKAEAEAVQPAEGSAKADNGEREGSAEASG